MAELQIENVVATGDLDTRINYFEILERITLPHLRYDPDIHQGLELRFAENGPLVTVYTTGKYIIRASSMSLLNETREAFLKLLSEEAIIDEPHDVAFDINNVVGSGDIEREVDLDALAPDLEIGEVNYQPDTFPAIRCQSPTYETTVLLYRSGKVIVTGADSVEAAEASYDEFRSTIERLFDNSDN